MQRPDEYDAWLNGAVFLGRADGQSERIPGALWQTRLRMKSADFAGRRAGDKSSASGWHIASAEAAFPFQHSHHELFWW